MTPPEAEDFSDPNDDYSIEPIPPGELMASQGWWQCLRNGAPEWFGPRERMQELATDPEARIEARRSKKHHDKKPK